MVVMPSIVAAMPFPGPIMPRILATTDVADMSAATTPVPTGIVTTTDVADALPPPPQLRLA